MRKYIIIVLVLFIGFPMVSFSQAWKLSRSEVILGLGTVNYFGDIGGKEDIEASALADFDFTSTRPNLSIGYRYKWEYNIAIKGNLIYANVNGSDASSLNSNRNFTFTTHMFELYGHAEYHLTPEYQMMKYSRKSLRSSFEKFNRKINLYVFAGIGVAYFKPKAKDDFSGDSRFVDNKNLTLVLPAGIGLKYPINENTYVGMEIGGRYTTTDYIDGYASEFSNYNDLYYISVIYVTRKIKRSQRLRF